MSTFPSRRVTRLVWVYNPPVSHRVPTKHVREPASDDTIEPNSRRVHRRRAGKREGTNQISFLILKLGMRWWPFISPVGPLGYGNRLQYGIRCCLDNKPQPDGPRPATESRFLIPGEFHR